jgi:DNA polymerase III sliding clamp (beta) subunit (PCNA family)
MSNVANMVLVQGGKAGVQVAGFNGFAGLHQQQGDPVGDPILIPSGNASALASILKKLPPDAEVTVSLLNDGGAVKVTGPECTWWSAVAYGKYPDLRQSIPTEELTMVTVNREVLIGACQRCNTFRDASSYIAIHVHDWDDEELVTISSPATEHGSASEHVHAEIVFPDDAKGVTVHLDYKAVMAGLQSCASERVVLGLPGKTGVLATIRPDDGTQTVALIAPRATGAAAS